MDEKELTFEKALVRLEAILKKLEGGEATLDESLTLFEEGIGLSAYCNGMLDKAEQKVVMLSKTEDGQMKEQAFSGREDA